MLALFVVAEAIVPRSTLCSFTSAPGTTAPVESEISPETVAVSVWPITTDVKHNTASTKPQATRSKRVIVIFAYPSSLVCPRSCQNSPNNFLIWRISNIESPFPHPHAHAHRSHGGRWATGHFPAHLYIPTLPARSSQCPLLMPHMSSLRSRGSGHVTPPARTRPAVFPPTCTIPTCPRQPA